MTSRPIEPVSRHPQESGDHAPRDVVPHAEPAEAEQRVLTRPPSAGLRISVIIPTLSEASTIRQTLDHLAVQRPDEIVVVDASGTDGTAGLATACGAHVIDSPRGRGVQQNRGARIACGDILVFLHADCRLEEGTLDRIARHVGANPRSPGGCLRMRVDAPDVLFRAIDAAAHLRGGVLGLPYGDQVQFAPRWAFEAVGGFPEVPLMEDLLFACKLRRLGRIALLPCRVFVSPRRWRHHGIVRQTLRNWFLTLLAVLGIAPKHLAAFYPPVR
jgi:rSAM/selenodomain-associated transferase 2